MHDEFFANDEKCICYLGPGHDPTARGDRLVMVATHVDGVATTYESVAPASLEPYAVARSIMRSVGQPFQLDTSHQLCPHPINTRDVGHRDR